MTTTAERPSRCLNTAPTFEELGVAPELTAALHSQGITQPFPVQELTIPDGIAGRDVCGKAKTGSGKTLAFGLPLLIRVGRGAERRPRALVLVPTRELATQVAEVLAPLATTVERRVVVVYGGADIDRQVKKLHKGVDVVIATPGRLIDLCERGEVSVRDIEVVVLDEADRMADMGFLPQVHWLLRRIESAHQTMLFSATLDGDVHRLVRRHLSDPVRHEVVSATTTVELMEHRFLQVHQMDKVKVAAAICRGASKVLVFVRTKRGLTASSSSFNARTWLRPRDSRRPSSVRPGEGPRGFLTGPCQGPGCHRRRGPWARHLRRGRGRALRSARRPQGLPPPFGPNCARGGPGSWRRLCCGTKSSRWSESRSVSVSRRR